MKQLLHPFRLLATGFCLLFLATAVHAGNELTVFPNPAGENCSIRYIPVSQAASFVVVDVTGTVVRKGSMNSSSYTSISLSDLPGGIYLVNIIDGDKTLTAKLIRQ